jgi:hypothetical protein
MDMAENRTSRPHWRKVIEQFEEEIREMVGDEIVTLDEFPVYIYCASSDHGGWIHSRPCYLFTRGGRLWVREEEWTERFDPAKDDYRVFNCLDECAHWGPLAFYADDVDDDDPDYHAWVDGPVAEELAWYAITRGWPGLYQKLVKKQKSKKLKSAA